jgi:hypothetical protein
VTVRVTARRQQPTTRARANTVNPFTHLGTLRMITQSGRRPTSVATPRAPSAPTPFSPTSSSAPTLGTPSATPAAQADPRDAQYFNDVAKLDQFYTSRKADLTASGEELARNLTKNNSLLAEQQPKDELSAKQNANKAGLFYSGALGKNLGDVAESYARRKSDLQSSYESSKGTLDRQDADLEANYGAGGLLRNDVLAQTIARQTAADQANAEALAAQQSAAPQPQETPVSTTPTPAVNYGTAAQRYAAAKKKNPIGAWGRY